MDDRQQLANDGLSGPVTTVSLSEAVITRLRGVLLDFDPGRLHPDVAPAAVLNDPDRLHAEVVRPWLDRDPVFAQAEVRCSGRGLHAIVWLDPVVEFATTADRQRWACAVRVVQRLLPTDPDCPGLTALTRPVGSMNGKTGRAVRVVRPGRPVPPADVLALCQRAARSPFATAAGLLFPGRRVSPCPVCRAAASRLDVLDRVGMCYGGCGKVPLARLFDQFLAPRGRAKGGR